MDDGSLWDYISSRPHFFACLIQTMVLSGDFANAPLLAADFGAGGVLLPKMQKMRSNQMGTDNQFVTSRDF